ncbi:MAG: DUF1572 domain-containing protein [Firmicutes bacterium]|nr:DUF1572 domain-containing protein [Bacillota bacterium]
MTTSSASVGAEYLKAVGERFSEMKGQAERAIAQLSDDQLFWAPDPESNSIAIIIKHLSGNMLSRWTDFFTTDGEKPNRQRDEEFESPAPTRAEVMAVWKTGWDRFLTTLDQIGEADLLRTVTIRNQPHSAIQAIERQMFHYSYHVGQIVYIAKALKSADWQTLTIPRRR